MAITNVFSQQPHDPALFDQTVPGVEVVLGATCAVGSLTATELRLIGNVYRRLAGKWADVARPVERSADQWTTRLVGYEAFRDRASHSSLPINVALPGLEVVEPAVLVDGVMVPASIVDLCVAVLSCAHALRDGEKVLTVTHPAASSSADSELWTALFTVAQDRAGVPRGTLVS